MDTSIFYKMKKADLQQKCKDFKIPYEGKETVLILIKKLEDYVVPRELATKATPEAIEKATKETEGKDSKAPKKEEKKEEKAKTKAKAKGKGKGNKTTAKKPSEKKKPENGDVVVTDKTGNNTVEQAGEVAEKPFIVSEGDNTTVIQENQGNPSLITQPSSKALVVVREELGRMGVTWHEHQGLQELLDIMRDHKADRGMSGTESPVPSVGGNQSIKSTSNVADMAQVLNQQGQFSGTEETTANTPIQTHATISETQLSDYGNSFLAQINAHFRPHTFKELNDFLNSGKHIFKLETKLNDEGNGAWIELTADCGTLKFPKEGYIEIRA